MHVYKQNNSYNVLTYIFFQCYPIYRFHTLQTGKCLLKNIIVFFFNFVMSDGGEIEDGCEGRCEVADNKPRWGAVGKRSVHGFPLVYFLKIFLVHLIVFLRRWRLTMSSINL